MFHRAPTLPAARQRLTEASQVLDGWPSEPMQQLVQGELDVTKPNTNGKISYVSRGIPGVLALIDAAEARARQEPNITEPRLEHRVEVQAARQEVMTAAAAAKRARIRVLIGRNAIAASSGDPELQQRQARELLAASLHGWDIRMVDDDVLAKTMPDEVTSSIVIRPETKPVLLYEQLDTEHIRQAEDLPANASIPHERVSFSQDAITTAQTIHDELTWLAMPIGDMRKLLAEQAGVSL